MRILTSGLALAIYSLIAQIASCAFCAEADLGDVLRQELAAMDCPGALVGVAIGASAPQVFVLGVADTRTRLPMRREFHMRIGSATKPFIGAVILQLADEGRLSLDDPISKYVSGVPEGDKITLRQLANHTSGLFNSIENKDFQAAMRAEPTRQWPAEEILKYAFAKPAYHVPGDKWRYSNTNTVLLGAVIEAVTGRPYADEVKTRVLAPLEMEVTGFTPGAGLPEPSPSGYRNGRLGNWVGYGKIIYDVTGYSASWTGAAGNIYSTVDDLLKATKRLATGALVSEKSRAALHTWVPTSDAALQYGFCLGNYGGWMGHFGDVPGFSCFVGYLPDRDATLVVLTNLSNNKDGTAPAERLRDVAIKHLQL